MNDETGRLVDDHDFFVLVNYFDGNVFRKERGRRQRGEISFDLILGPQFVRRLRGATVDQDLSVIDQTLQTGTAPTLDLLGQKRIQPLARIFFFYVEIFDGRQLRDRALIACTE
jgi:hypothetical protein